MSARSAVLVVLTDHILMTMALVCVCSAGAQLIALKKHKPAPDPLMVREQDGSKSIGQAADASME